MIFCFIFLADLELFQHKPKSALKRKSDSLHNNWRTKKIKKEVKSVKWSDQQDEKWRNKKVKWNDQQDGRKRARSTNFKNNKSNRKGNFKTGGKNKRKQTIIQPRRKRKQGSRVTKDGRRY